jgi:hypothetical protein
LALTSSSHHLGIFRASGQSGFISELPPSNRLSCDKRSTSSTMVPPSSLRRMQPGDVLCPIIENSPERFRVSEAKGKSRRYSGNRQGFGQQMTDPQLP